MGGFKSNESHVLYELLVYSEWKQEPELWKNRRLSESPTKSRFLSVFNKINWPAEEIYRLNHLLLPWQISVSEDGKIVAVLQETTLEIRTSRDDFTSILGKAIVFRDPSPQWRKMEWSSDCSMLAVSSSTGSVNVYDLLGSHLFTIPPASEHPTFSEPFVASLIFIKARTRNPKWSLELLVIGYNGILTSYYVSTTDGYLEAHSLTLSRNGISAATSNPNHNLLFVALRPQQKNLSEDSCHSFGLSVWRIMNDHPYYKMNLPSSKECSDYSPTKMILNWFNMKHQISYIFKMKLSPKGNFMSCLHSDGTISIWAIPSLRIHQKWSLEDQEMLFPASDSTLSSDLILPRHHPIDTEWRADEKLIIARLDGNILVCDIDPLKLCDGSDPEHLSGYPRISSAPSHSGFLALECEEIFLNPEVASLRKVGSDENNSFLNTSSELIQSTIYMITDLEKYEPKKKPNKIVQRTYKLLGVKSTTPEELFNRKLDYEDYDEALVLAKKYFLDCDRVYQRQWRNSPVISSTLEDYLNKIINKIWVLNEFVKRVPETLNGAKELMNYAFHYTDFKNVLPDVSPDQIDRIHIPELDPIQKQMVLTRIKLIEYADKLSIYELIIKDERPEDHYDMMQYEQFRKQHLVDSAIQFARSGNVKAVTLIMTYHPEETKLYLLNILENFPETLASSKYSELLPECDGDYNLISLEKTVNKAKDWCLHPKFRYLSEVVNSEEWSLKDGSFYEMNIQTVEKWYINRISMIEEKTGIIDNSLELLTLAKKRNIKGLDSLHADLLTLETLVYDLYIYDMSLQILHICSPLEVAYLLTSKTEVDDVFKDLLHFVIPYFERCEQHNLGTKFELLLGILVSISTYDLSGLIKLVKHAFNGNLKLIGNVRDVVELVIRCIYAYEDHDQLFESSSILSDTIDWLTPLSKYSGKKTWLQHLNDLKDEVDAVGIFVKNGTYISVKYLHTIKEDIPIMKQLLYDMSKIFFNSKDHHFQEKACNQLLDDIIFLQSRTLKRMPLSECYEVYVLTLLESGSIKMIEFAANVLCCSFNEELDKSLSLDQSIALVIQTARKYYDAALQHDSPSIHLAKRCLLLIKEENEGIQEELDLISSLRVLIEYGVYMMPVEVRQTEDRLSLILECLNKNPTAYKDACRIYKLAAKIRVCGYNSSLRYCIVTISLAQSALKDRAYDICADFCEELIVREHSVGWNICLKLAEKEQYTNVAKKLHLLSFTILHCPSRLLLHVIKLRSELELQWCESKLGNQENKSHMLQKMLLLKDSNPMFNNEHMYHRREEDTLSSMSLITSGKMFLHTISGDLFNSQYYHSGIVESKSIEGDFENGNLSTFASHPFYGSLFNPGYTSISSTTYERPDFSYDPTSSLKMCDIFLNAVMLYQQVNSFVTHIFCDNVLVDCSKMVIFQDTSLGLSYLLSLHDPNISEDCFGSLSKSLFSYELLIYYFSLRSCISEFPNILYHHPQKVLNKALSKQDSNYISKIHKYQEELKDYHEIRKIQELKCGINTQRFSTDEDYKKDSIIGLAMSEDYVKLQFALEMSTKNNIPDFEVAVSHLVSLFVNEHYSLILDRIAEKSFASLLKEHQKPTLEKLKSDILPNLTGYNYQGLITFFTVIKMLSEEELIFGLKAKEHIKLLKKIRATSNAIDYRELIFNKCSVVEVFQPVINSDNIGNFHKLIKSLPSYLKENVSPNALYLHWAIKQFSQKCLDQSLSTKQCVQKFEALFNFLNKLTSDELIMFLDKTIFSPGVIYNVSATSRKHILNCFFNWYSEHYTKSKKENNILSLLDHRIDFMNKIWDDELDPDVTEKLKSHLLLLEENIPHDGKRAEVVFNSIFDENLTPNEAGMIYNSSGLKQCLPDIILEYFKPVIHADRISLLINRIESFLKESNDTDKWPAILINIIESECIDTQAKIYAADVMKKLQNKSSEDGENHLLLITKSLLCDKWKIKDIDISNETARADLFQKLLKDTKTIEQITTLYNLLLEWPSFNELKIQLLKDLVETLLLVEGQNKYSLLCKILKSFSFPNEILNELVDNNQKKGDPVSLGLMCILSDSEYLHNKASDLLRTVEVTMAPEIATEFISRGYLPEFVDAKMYQHILDSGNDSLIKLTFNTFKQANLLPEAGTMLMDFNGVPPTLRTYNSAYYLSKNK